MLEFMVNPCMAQNKYSTKLTLFRCTSVDMKKLRATGQEIAERHAYETLNEDTRTGYSGKVYLMHFNFLKEKEKGGWRPHV